MRFDVPPEEAIDFFRRRKTLPADEFRKLDAEAKRGAFAIANVYKTDVADALKNEITDALANGRTQDQVIKKLKAILAGSAHRQLGDAHLETVYRTATQMAYAVGRRIAQEEAAEYLPVWEYSAVGDDRTRPTHRALDGLQFPANHSFWTRYYPPWDFRCRCTVIPVLDFRPGYDRARPNAGTVLEYDEEGMPAGANVHGTPLNFKAVNFSGVPSAASLETVLKKAAQRALDSRNQ
jgi:SPP1 gp7 family putative phage head morphogenesis protein